MCTVRVECASKFLAIEKEHAERALQFVDGPIAQSVEQLAFNQWVAGSSPARLTIVINNLGQRFDRKWLPYWFWCANSVRVRRLSAVK